MYRKNRMLSVRDTGLLIGFFVVSILLLSSSSSASAELELIAMDGKKIVTSSSVHIHLSPSPEADTVGMLGLGAVVTATQRSKDKLQNGEANHYWYYIAVEGSEEMSEVNKKNGWVSGSFLRDFKAEQKEKIWFGVIQKQMDDAKLSFEDRKSLHAFASLVAAKSQDEKLQGAFELGELLALQKSFDVINKVEDTQQEPYLSWVKQHEAKGCVLRDEVSGQWLVPATDFWRLADKYEGRASTDEIAWYAANASLGGECEGDISCNLSREQLTQGEYLRRHPYGRYAATSLQRLGDALSSIQEKIGEQPTYFDDVDSGELETIETLFEIIANTNPKLTERAKAFKQIKAIRNTAKPE